MRDRGCLRVRRVVRTGAATVSAWALWRQSSDRNRMLTANRIKPKNRSAWASVSTSYKAMTTHSPDATEVTFDVRILLIMPVPL